ncbi:unnamed protein product [Camellia sinensis]
MFSDEGLPVSGDESMHEILQKALLRTIHDIDTKFSLYLKMALLASSAADLVREAAAELSMADRDLALSKKRSSFDEVALGFVGGVIAASEKLGESLLGEIVHPEVHEDSDENNSQIPLDGFMIQFNKNTFGLAAAGLLQVPQLLPGTSARTLLPMVLFQNVASGPPNTLLQVAVKNNQPSASITVLDVEELTRDHHPYRDDERARIEAAGGFVRLWGSYTEDQPTSMEPQWLTSYPCCLLQRQSLLCIQLMDNRKKGIASTFHNLWNVCTAKDHRHLGWELREIEAPANPEQKWGSLSLYNDSIGGRVLDQTSDRKPFPEVFRQCGFWKEKELLFESRTSELVLFNHETHEIRNLEMYGCGNTLGLWAVCYKEICYPIIPFINRNYTY